MKSMKSRNLVLLFVLFVFFVVKSDTHAAEKVDHAAVLTPLLSNDTFAVAYLDIAAFPASGNQNEIFALLPLLPQDAQESILGMMIVGSLIDKFQAAGGQGIYVVAGLGDLNELGGPVIVATAAPGKRPEQIAQMLQDVVQNIRDDKNQVALHPIAEMLNVRRQGDVVLFGTRNTVNRYSLVLASERNDFIEPLTRLTGEGAVLAGAFAPGPDFRRVVRELWPPMPAPLTALKGELADRWRTLEFAANLPPNPNPRLTLRTTDLQSSQTFADLYRALPAAVDQFTELGDGRHELKTSLEAILALLPATIYNTRVDLKLNLGDPQIQNLHSLIATATDKAMESSRRHQRMNQFKQITLAMLNYESAKKRLPPAAISGKDGRPLLSWRVAILPYLGEKALYDQFHLDEPWDSAHNRALVAKMPGVFADPDPKVRNIAGAGTTTYQVPVAPETIFFNNEGATIREITDGTSKTVALVEVEPLHAVPWTKPADWEVNIENVRRGIEHTDHKQFAAGFMDGSIMMLPADIDEATLHAMLTRAGGEVYDAP